MNWNFILEKSGEILAFSFLIIAVYTFSKYAIGYRKAAKKASWNEIVFILIKRILVSIVLAYVIDISKSKEWDLIFFIIIIIPALLGVVTGFGELYKLTEEQRGQKFPRNKLL